MCVIVYRPKGTKMPSEEVLRAMYAANPHGCGFCTPTKYYRGLSFTAFMKNIAKVGTKEPCIIHFRLATHGSIKRNNCHPFYDAATGTYFAHNGVLNIQPYKDTTDSETAFRSLFVPYISRYGMRSDELRLSLSQTRANTGSRFAFMQGDKVYLYGDFVPYEGCLCSNLRFVYYMHGESSHSHRFGL